MHQIPINFHLRGRASVIVGGRADLAPALRHMLRAGSLVRVVAERIDVALQDSLSGGCGTWERRAFAPRDLYEAVLVLVATGNAARDEEVARAARASRVPVALPDRPDLSDFTLGLNDDPPLQQQAPAERQYWHAVPHPGSIGK